MRISRKINIKSFLFFNILTTGIFSYFCANETEIYVLIGVALAAMINQIMLCAAVELLTDSAGQEKKSSKMIYLMLGKLLILFCSLGLGVHFIGDRIIISVFNYIAQIAALGFSLKRNK